MNRVQRLEMIHLAKDILGSSATIAQVLLAAKQIELFVVGENPNEWDTLLLNEKQEIHNEEA